MTHGSNKGILSRGLIGLACVCAGVFGLFVGTAASLHLAGQPASSVPEYVQRVVLSMTPPELVNIASSLPDASEDPPLPEVETEQLALADEGGVSPASSRRNALDLAMQSFVAEAPAATLANGREVMAVNFDLGSAPSARDMVEVATPIRLNGKPMGEVMLSIDPQSRLHLSNSELSHVLPADLYARIDNGAELIAFDRLRAKGLTVRYDPLADTVEIDS